jgi:hypothetical protein
VPFDCVLAVFGVRREYVCRAYRPAARLAALPDVQ